MLHREAQLSPHGTVRLEPRSLRVLLIQAAGVIRIRATDPHTALVVEHRQQTVRFPLDQIQTVLVNKQTERFSE